jgi:hypothetical protein
VAWPISEDRNRPSTSSVGVIDRVACTRLEEAAIVSALTPAEVVQAYIDGVYRDRNADVAVSLMAEPSLRHDVDGKTTVLTKADVLGRIIHIFDRFPKLEMPARFLVADDHGVAMMWDTVNVNPDGSEIRLCGIEIFRVVDGQITEVWNQPMSPGIWSEEAWGRLSEAGTGPLPVVETTEWVSLPE